MKGKRTGISNESGAISLPSPYTVAFSSAGGPDLARYVVMAERENGNWSGTCPEANWVGGIDGSWKKFCSWAIEGVRFAIERDDGTQPENYAITVIPYMRF